MSISNLFFVVDNTEGYIRVNDSIKTFFHNGFMLQKNAM